MKDLSNFKRYPFALTDDEGYVLLSSFPLRSEGENIFSSSCLSAADSEFAIKRIREYKYGHIILLRDKRNGKAVFLCPFLFPSTRTFLALYTDIDYGIAADLCSACHKDIALRERKSVNETVRHERAYSTLERVIFSLNTMFGTEYDNYCGYGFGTYLRNKTDEIARLAFCDAETDIENEFILSPPGDFDVGVFGLYMLIMLSAASEASPLRKASVKISDRDGCIGAEVVFDTPFDKKSISEFETRFEMAVKKLDEACERLNMPTYFLRDGVFRSGIIPKRVDCAMIGLKATEGYLKDEEQNEDDKRNIFAFVPFSADE